MNPIQWIRIQGDRYRAWREARANERLRQFIAEAKNPENKARLRRECEKEYGRLILNECGFYLLKNGQCEIAIRWTDVHTIQTFKRDYFTYDMICLAFEIGKNEWIEIWESMVDFMKVTAKMHEEFSTIPQGWYTVVMFPAFEPNCRILWRREFDNGPALSHDTEP
ncbi:MAG: hypothetical protein HJJLKODD_00840 [Phycisphaerae bacterium]|nr:hypothetical protein [Phycisphaerae bacterium]